MNNNTKLRNSWGKKLSVYLKPITWCEKCGTQVGPHGDIAHRKKRRFILTIEEYFMAARLCRPCHSGLDENWNREGVEGFDQHQIMFDEISALVYGRDPTDLDSSLRQKYPEG